LSQLIFTIAMCSSRAYTDIRLLPKLMVWLVRGVDQRPVREYHLVNVVKLNKARTAEAVGSLKNRVAVGGNAAMTNASKRDSTACEAGEVVVRDNRDGEELAAAGVMKNGADYLLLVGGIEEAEGLERATSVKYSAGARGGESDE
jgi:hypothetical protein